MLELIAYGFVEVSPFRGGVQKFVDHDWGHIEVAVDRTVSELEFQQACMRVIANGCEGGGNHWRTAGSAGVHRFEDRTVPGHRAIGQEIDREMFDAAIESTL